MRRLLEKEKGSKNPWEIKQVAGGLIDVEFLAQFLLLRHAHEHEEILVTTVSAALERLKNAGLLDQTAAETLIAAVRLYQGLTQLLRLSIDDEFRPKDAPRGLVELLLRASDAPDLARLEAHLVETQRAVRELFVAIIGEVAIS